MRPRASSALGERGISRFPCVVFRYVRGVCDHAGLAYASQYRRTRCCLPPLLTASASRRICFSRLDTRPAPSPVNASKPPSRAAPHDSEPVWFGRVRWWRVSGLRMMPPFPPPPLSFRTAGFPQYGWKAGLSDSAFPRIAQIKPAPGIPCASRRFASALRALRGHTLRPALRQDSGLGVTPPFEDDSPLPQRSSLRSGFCCPGPSTLIRPHPPRSQAHPDFAALRFIWDAFAVLVRLGDPRVVPCFRCMLLLDMPSSTTTGILSVAHALFLHRQRWPSPGLERLGTPKYPIIRFRWDSVFVASLVHCVLLHSLRPVDLLAPLADPTGHFSQPAGTFTSGLSTGRSPFPPPDMTTVATGQFPPTGLSPAGTTASIAAPKPSLHETFIHYTSPVFLPAHKEIDSHAH